MRSPFKFLDAYTSADKEIFFGREKEIDILYNMVFKTPLALVYGMSGTGKTSLIQCGLSTRFDGPDWLPFYIRRDKNINESLQKALSVDLEGKEYSSLPTAVEDLFYAYFRPVYLIFDQFEELFILGSAEEQQQFLQDIQTLIDKELPCKIILVMREEYLGQLYDFEKLVPGIFDYKLRVEPMSNKRVQRVMLDSFKHFNIQLEEPEDALCQQMIDNISAGKSGIALTYLQVYLDMLYREDFGRTYPNEVPDEKYPALEFTHAEVEHFGQIDDVLDRYLKERVVDIEANIRQAFPNEYMEDSTSRLLDVFVTEEGTKRPLNYTRAEDLVLLEGDINERLHLPKEIISYCILQLEEARLIRFDENTIELGHDTLADLIDQQRTDQQRQLNDIKKRLSSDFKNYKQTGEYLSDKRLNLYEEYLPSLRLSDLQTKFIGESKVHNEQLVAAEKERDRKEQEQQKRELKLTKEKLLTEKRARRKQYFFSALLGLSLLIAVGLAFWALREQKIAKDKTEEADKSKKEAEQLSDDLFGAYKDLAREQYDISYDRALLNYRNDQFREAQGDAESAKNIVNDFYQDLKDRNIVDSLAMQFRDSIDNNASKAIALLQQLETELPNLPSYTELIEKGKKEEKNKDYVAAYNSFKKARGHLNTPTVNSYMKNAIQKGYSYYISRGKSHLESGTPADRTLAKDKFIKAKILNSTKEIEILLNGLDY